MSNAVKQTGKRKRCSEFHRIFSISQTGSILIALLFMPAVMAQDLPVKPLAVSPEIKATTMGIMNCIKELPRMGDATPAVNVPSTSYAGILQELQNQHARFLSPGSQIPMNAKVVFRLEATDAGLSQTVYFI